MKKLMTLAALAALCAARAQETTTETRTTVEEIDLPGGAKVTIENNNRVVYTGRNTVDKKLRRAAIFISNTAGPACDELLPRIENQVSAQVAGDEFEVINYDDALRAVAALPDAVKTADGVGQQRRVQGLQADLNRLQGNLAQKNLGGEGTTADERFLAQASPVQITQLLDADYVLKLTIDKYTPGVAKTVNLGGGLKRKDTTFALSASYKVMDFRGFAIGGNTLKATKTIPTGVDDVEIPAFGDLDEEVAALLAKDMLKNAQKWRESTLDKGRVTVSFDAMAMTMDNQPIYVPEFDKEKKEVVLDSQVPVRIAAIVEVDGVAEGTTDCAVPVAPGLHTVRIHRDGFDAVTLTINARENLAIVAPLRCTEGEMNRVMKLLDVIHGRTKDRTLAEAMAEFLENSHFRVDATNLPDTHILNTFPPPQNINVINNNAVGVEN